MGKHAKEIQKNEQAQSDDTASQTLKLAIEIVSATKLSENDFWSKAALGLSLQRHLKQDARLSVNIAFENSRGLSEIFNEYIHQVADDAILVFIHDDVWIDEVNFSDAVIAGLENFDVIGVAGNRRRVPNQPAWAFIDNQLTWDDKSNLSGRIANGKNAYGQVSDFGTVPAECELVDGIFLAAKKSSLKQNMVQFDAQFDFHFYDMDFCRSARKAGLRLGTWPVNLTHQSGGSFGSKNWNAKYQRYLNKWEAPAASNGITLSPHELSDKEQELQQAINDVLQTALSHQNDGQLKQAEHIYLEILKIQPKHAAANHALGLMEINLIGALAALPRLKIAVIEKPENEPFWVSYIDALMQSGPADSVADALELGLKYGLRSETAQALAADFVTILESKMASRQDLAAAPAIGIHIHQIYYSKQTQRDNDSGFIGLDNLANPRPDWSEYWSIRNYLQKTPLNEDGYYGFFSPRFKSKTNLDAAAVHEFVNAFSDEADVFLFSPYFDQSAFFLNVFEQGERGHPGIMTTFQACVAMIAPDVNLATLVMDSRNTVYCNYIVAKPAFWKVWLESCELIFAIAEENKSVLALSLNTSTKYHGGVAPNKVFVIERIASLLLSTQPHWKMKAYYPTRLPYSKTTIAKYPHELLLMDALKIASVSQAYPDQYLSMFSQIRQSILSSIEKAKS
nr:glycosyltransferase [Rhodoferax sp.]